MSWISATSNGAAFDGATYATGSGSYRDGSQEGLNGALRLMKIRHRPIRIALIPPPSRDAGATFRSELRAARNGTATQFRDTRPAVPESSGSASEDPSSL